MRVAAGVDEQVAEETVHQPGRARQSVCLACPRRRRRRGKVARAVALVGPAGPLSCLGELPIEFFERDFQFVERIVAGFVDARRLRGGADEQTAEEPAERRVILPVGQQRTEQVGPPQHG